MRRVGSAERRLSRAEILLGGVGIMVLLAAPPGCGGKNADLPPPGAQGDQLLLELGQRAFEDHDWEEARGHFRQLLDTYPRSRLAGDARIGIADTYFFQGGTSNYILAIAEYRDFLTFFPNHPRADYVQYQIALAYYEQMHNADRDQSPTRTAAEELETLIELYRNSPYAEDARALLQECYDRLAEHEFEVGRFYLKTRKHCRAAIARFKAVLEEFPTYSRSDEVYFHLGEAHQLCNRPGEAMPYYKQVIDNYPQSELKKEAESRLGALQAKIETASNPIPPP